MLIEIYMYVTLTYMHITRNYKLKKQRLRVNNDNLTPKIFPSSQILCMPIRSPNLDMCRIQRNGRKQNIYETWTKNKCVQS